MSDIDGQLIESGAVFGGSFFALNRMEGRVIDAGAVFGGRLRSEGFSLDVGIALFRLGTVYNPAFFAFDDVFPTPALDTSVYEARVRQLSWNDPLTEAGQGVVEFQPDLTEPSYFPSRIESNGAYVIDPSFVTVYAAGEPCFSMILEEATDVTVAEGEKEDETITYTGRGTLAFLDRALVYPALGIDNLPAETDRKFDWTDPRYDDSSWGASRILTTVYAVVPAPWGAYNPGAWPVFPWTPAFPDKTAAILAPPSGSTSSAPVGDYYGRDQATTSSDKLFVVAMCDDYGEFFIDGVHVLAVRHWSNDAGDTPDNWSPVDSAEVKFSAGQHTFAWTGHNSGGPTGFAAAVYEFGYPPTLVWHTGSTGKMLSYPGSVPGMTAGQIMNICMDEAQDRGAIPWLTRGFSDHADYYGNAWPVLPGVSCKVGTSLYQFFRGELGGTHTDMWMPPGGLQVCASRYGRRGASRAATITTGINLTHAEFKRPLVGPQTLLIQSQAGWDERSLVGWPDRHEAFLDLGSQFDKVEVAQQGNAELTEHRPEPTGQLTLAYEVTSEGDAAYLAYWVGDVINVIDRFQNPATARVMSISGSWGDGERLIFVPVVGKLILSSQARTFHAMRRLIDGSLGGRSRRAQPLSGHGVAQGTRPDGKLGPT